MQYELAPERLQSLPLAMDDPLVKCVCRIVENDGSDTDHWSLTYETEEPVWLSFQKRGASLPDQGWKLHISADLTSAEPVLQRILPFLLQKTVSFKFTSSLNHLQRLNSGLLGESQIGKFL